MNRLVFGFVALLSVALGIAALFAIPRQGPSPIAFIEQSRFDAIERGLLDTFAYGFLAPLDAEAIDLFGYEVFYGVPGGTRYGARLHGVEIPSDVLASRTGSSPLFDKTIRRDRHAPDWVRRSSALPSSHARDDLTDHLHGFAWSYDQAERVLTISFSIPPGIENPPWLADALLHARVVRDDLLSVGIDYHIWSDVHLIPQTSETARYPSP